MRFGLLIITLIFISCSRTEYQYSQDNALINADNLGKHSTTAGNLITTALREVHDLDIALYPNYLLRKNNLGLFHSDSSKIDINQIESIYPSGEKDTFVIGYMSGRNLKEFIKQRTLEFYALELEVSGMAYEIFLNHGEIISEAFLFNGITLDESRFYKIALSKFFIFSSETFPSYKYRNSIDRIFIDTDMTISARESLKTYLTKNKNFPLWTRMRALVTNTTSKFIGTKSISQIQGKGHMSPYRGMTVETNGIVTAIAEIEYYPGGKEVFIQSQTPDNDPKTSEGLKLYLTKNSNFDVQVGDLIKVTGDVYEETSHIQNSLTTTSLRDISDITVLKTSLSLPKAKELTKLPKKYFSTYNGNINLKKELKLTDGLDYWESVENMRVSIKSPRIIGFRGGKEQSDDHKKHLTLFLLPNGNNRTNMDSPSDGILADTDNHIHNPQIIPLTSGPLTTGLRIDENYKIGDVIHGEINGLLTFSKNLFGDAEYVLFTPEKQKSLDEYYSQISERCFGELSNRNNIECKDTERPAIKSEHGYELTIAAYNVKNLSPVNEDRIIDTAYMIKNNLQCPDVLGLVEIQDNNGEDFSGDASANDTLTELIKNIDCSFEYQEANLDPLLHREGGVPGGNIRVALIYNPKKLYLPYKRLPNNVSETIVDKYGELNFNPGRIGVNTRAFENTRKSIIVQFKFYDRERKQRDLYVAVNHLNSKLSDTSSFSSRWPMVYPSEIKRSRMAEEVNNFVRRIELYKPEALIAVVGDFNEYMNRPAMRVLEGDVLYNLMRDIPKNERYTTNHNGNSQSLDYIFINRNLRRHKPRFEVLHLNSDFMGRLSDHDPIWSGFKF